MFTTTIRRWLKAGVVELGTRKDTNTGTPQGGIASPLLANIALDGMERLFGGENAKGKPIRPAIRRGDNRGIGLVRYADDFVVTAPTKEALETYVKPKLAAFLAERGLEMSGAKTRIVHVDEGFDFLGFNVCRRGRKVLTTPQKAKVLSHLRRIKAYLDAHRQATVNEVIGDLNPVIRGWSAYYRHGASKRVLATADHRVWGMLWRWCIRRHKNKGLGWVKARYFLRRKGRDWTFADVGGGGTSYVLPRHGDTRVCRYVKVQGKRSPMDPDDRAYWEAKKRAKMAEQTTSWTRFYKLREQDGRCAMCGITFDPDEDVDQIDAHHDRPRHGGGSDDPSNLRLVHRWCHHGHHMRNGYRAVEAQAV